MGKTRELPEWARNMTDEEWAERGSGEYGKGTTNCSACGKRLLLTLCRYDEPKFYCVEHCPEHKWQTDYDWSIECSRCSVHYPNYLESVLDLHGIEFNRLRVDKAGRNVNG